MTLTIKLLIGVLVATVIGLITFTIIDPDINKTPIVTTSGASSNEEVYKVEISGEINNAGVYYVEKDATLDELITSAGGLTNNADLLCFETTLTLEDNASYYIAPIYEVNDICGNTKLKKCNINSCEANELQEIEGIGSSISKAIVNYRSEIGSYRQLEDIMKVNGIGNSTFSKLKNFIRLKDA
jgi:competence protein ComEA